MKKTTKAIKKTTTKPKKVLNEYLHDEDGFVEVEFQDSDGTIMEYMAPEKEVDLGPGFEVPEEQRKLADEGKLTQKMLLDMDTTSMLRLATYEPAGKQIMELVGFRGLPLKEPFTLRAHQMQTLTWMRARENTDPAKVFGLRGGIAKLEQGLGKTLTALALILTSPKGEFPTLVVASKTVMYEWRSEGVNKFFGNNIKVLYLHNDFVGANFMKQVARKDIVGVDIVVTTYDVLVAACRKFPYHQQTYEMGDDHTMQKGKKVAIHHRTREQCDRPNTKGPGVLFCTPWERIICDESQRFANPKTNIYECVMALYGEKIWCLTGTPIRNYDTDIWAQFRFCGYTGVTQALEWKRTSMAKYNVHRLNEAIFSMDYKDAKITLPPRTEYIDLVALSGNHKIFYEWVLGQTRIAYDEMMKGFLDFACVLAWFTALRQTAIAPYLFTANSKRNKATGKAKKHKDEMMAKIKKQFANSEMFKWLTDKTTDSGINSVKIKEIVNIISRIPKGDKVLVFSMFTSCTDLVADAVKALLPDFEYVQVDGDVTGKDRATLLEKFKTDPNVGGLFMTYKVGSEGLNLVQATHCICIEPWWTDAVHRQAKARCWRMGQTREVHVHNVYVQNTIEEKVTDICKAKNEMAAAFLEGTEKSLKKNVGLDKHTLGKILGIN
jgi:SNF2 family DNA or RNA helicase